MNETILVSGGAGYIGSHAVKQLLNLGYKVIVLDNFSTGHFQAVDPRAMVVVGDIRDKEVVKAVFENNKISGVMNFAAKIIVPESVKNPLAYYDDNILGVMTLLRACNRYQVRNFVFSSTAAVYGTCKDEAITEDHPLSPESPYGFTKYVAEKLLIDAEKAYGIKHVIFRYFNVAGASKDSSIGEAHPVETHLIPVTINSCIYNRPMQVFGNDFNTRDGTCLRDYIHVLDLAKAHVLGMKHLLDGKESEIFNLGSQTGYTNLEILKTVESVLQKKINYTFGPRRAGDAASIVASNSKAKEILGWTIENTLQDMIQDDYNFRMKNKNLYGSKRYKVPYGYKKRLLAYNSTKNVLSLLEDIEKEDEKILTNIKKVNNL